MGGTDTQVENPSPCLHQTEATTTGHVIENLFLSGLCFDSRVIEQVQVFDCVKIHHINYSVAMLSELCLDSRAID